ncbi:respiratory chain complex I subunit 1 family protein [Desulfolutivibrio sulfoxidireducens]|uniref:respiratory chain complex I subunit 1 family protein n=1 Tax=Desulfolutivibrio sulfoxidireducens TaxID=2773299 RepID=UPI00159DF3BF|nr:NADH-quinone oxidoreductase subunit H [Desulfolutivibrio sulfoxidireducens]QLA17575.1 hydrogenase [Desulfolutivibrio sulfoxidireducens]
MTASALSVILALVLAPLALGIINRVKAVFGGRRGKPLAQTYLDIIKCLGKGATISRTTTWLFQAGPAVNLAATAAALLFVPLGNLPAVISFPGDIFVFAYLLAMGRFFTIMAALDTGSSFEDMGASREAVYSCLAEPMLFLALLALARYSDSLSLSGMLAAVSSGSWVSGAPVLALVTVSLFLLLLSENCRVPFDDPNTHLELTMIHEVMVLDHSGPDLAFIQYAQSLKLWIFAAITASLILPAASASPPREAIWGLAGIFLAAVVVGVTESIMARLRLTRVPPLLAAAGAFAALALILVGN